MVADAVKPNVTGTQVLHRNGGDVWVHRAMRLHVEGAAEGGVTLGSAPIRVGTADDNDLVVADGTASARHCEVTLTHQGVVIRDLASTNGTYVDGVRIEVARLHPGALVTVGQTRLLFTVDANEVTTPLSSRTNFGALLGHSPAMKAAFAVLEQVARTDTTVLITGESGTGKELAARGLHDASPRRDGPYVVYDCGAASPTLIESALFGHTRGAFTGATEARAGVFEQANGGTLVLDEIGELPLELQPKLLRALESRTVRRLGEAQDRAFDVRFVASTNRNLQAEARAQRFRSDLYFRLSVITVTLPPLRERREELPRLVAHLVQRLAGDGAPEVPPAAMRLLAAYDWPGNVRELRNVVERLLVVPGMSAEAALGLAPSNNATTATLEFHAAKEARIEEFERAYLKERLDEAHGNISEAARVAGLSRQSMHRLINKYGLA